jgi:hypothetical protein
MLFGFSKNIYIFIGRSTNIHRHLKDLKCTENSTSGRKKVTVNKWPLTMYTTDVVHYTQFLLSDEEVNTFVVIIY